MNCDILLIFLCIGPACISGSSVKGHSAVAKLAFSISRDRDHIDVPSYLRPRSLDEFNTVDDTERLPRLPF